MMNLTEQEKDKISSEIEEKVSRNEEIDFDELLNKHRTDGNIAPSSKNKEKITDNQEEITDNQEEITDNQENIDDNNIIQPIYDSIEDVLDSGDDEKIEKLALQRGWYPNKDKFKGDNHKKFVEAKEFLLRRHASDQIKSLRETTKGKDKKIDALLKLNVKLLKDVVYKDRQEWAQANKNEAKEKNDIESYEKYKALEEENKQEIEKLTEEVNLIDKQPEIDEQPEEEKISFEKIPHSVKNFFNANKNWLISEDDIKNNSSKMSNPTIRAMNNFFYAEDARIKKEHPDYDWDAYINELDNSIKAAFPQVFRNIQRDKPPPVMSSSPANKKAGKKIVTYAMLPDEIKFHVNQMVEQLGGALTKDEYAQQLLEEGFIKVD